MLIVGDHGFSKIHSAVNLNSILLELGYAELRHKHQAKVVDVMESGSSGAFYPKANASAANSTRFPSAHDHFSSRLSESDGLLYEGGPAPPGAPTRKQSQDTALPIPALTPSAVCLITVSVIDTRREAVEKTFSVKPAPEVPWEALRPHSLCRAMARNSM